MSATTNVLSPLGEGGRPMLPLARRETPCATWRLPATSQLMAPPSGLVLPTLERVPTEQRFSADDREVIALVEILVRYGIADVDDWKKSGSDAAKCLFLTLQRWIRDQIGRAHV